MSSRFVMLLAAAVIILGVSAGHTQTPRKIEIVASRFSFTPNEITLKKDEPVVLNLRSTDVTHGLKVAGLDIKTEIKKGKDTEIKLTPAAVGRFVGQCAHFCGKGHGSMTLQVNVVP